MPSTIEIDRAGDLTLVLTTPPTSPSTSSSTTTTTTTTTTTVNLHVSSKILALASPVFSAMLSPSFLEGQRSASGMLSPLALPDDNAAAMTTLCQIFHFRYDMLPPTRPSLELFRDLAVLSDKYDCVAPLRFVSESWLVSWEAEARREDLEVLLWVSWVFGRGERLAVLSRRIVREFSGNLKHLATLGGFDGVPEELLRGLQQQRKATLKGIEAAVAQQLETMNGVCDRSFTMSSALRLCTSCFGFVQPSVQLCPKCRASSAPAICWRQSRQGEYIGFLKEAGLDPLRLWSVMGTKSINEISRNMLTAMEASTHHKCDGSTTCPLKNTFALLYKDVVNLAFDNRGLCLDCMNSEQDNIDLKVSCATSHRDRSLVEALEATLLSKES